MTIESSGALAGSQVDADTVDGQHASATPAASKLLSLDASSNFPISVIANGAITNDKIANTAIQAAKAKLAKGDSTGTGSQQTIAHGLGAAPNVILLTPTSTGADAFESAAADATNIYITAVNLKTYKWVAWV